MAHYKFNLTSFILTLIVVTSFYQQAIADEKWTQWGGAHRDFDIENVELSDKPALTEQWRRELGNGYSAILCDDDRLFTMYRQDDNEHIVCLDRKTGETICDIDYPK